VDVVGMPVPPVDWHEKTDGSLAYAGDVSLPDMLIGAVVRSPHPHARILRVDTSAAQAMPGVHAVLTARDLPTRKYLDYRPADADRYALARDRVRHIGDCVAVVAAESAETAAQAASAVRVHYRRMPAAVTVAEALRPAAAAIHNERPDNIAKRGHHVFGDQGQARAATATSVRARYHTSRQAHATMEPHTVVAHWSADEARLHMWTPSQAPRVLQRDIAQMLELDLPQVHLHEVGVGGDFGGRTQISSLEVLAGALSMAANRPVRLSHTRAEEFAFSKSRLSWDLELDLGCDAEGRLTYLSATADVDNGAYNQAGPGEMDYGLVALGSSYRLRGYEVTGRCVYTNKQPPSSFRGAGGYPVNFALECAIDELAERAGIDPIDFRIKNALSRKNEQSITGWTVKSSELVKCLEAVRREIDWDAKRAQGGDGYGVGVACSIHVTALHREHMMRSSAALDISPDGRVTLRSGCGDAGTGQKTILCQTVAEILGVAADDVDIISTDTARTPHDAGAGASRGSFVSVSTVKQLSEAARDRLRAAAAGKFHVSATDVRLEGGSAVAPGHSALIGDLVVIARDGDSDSLNFATDFVGPFNKVPGYGHEDVAPTYSFAAQAVEVHVDRDTGKVRVLRVVAAHDSGTILNPITARGQVEGGVVMGLGAALSEELIYEGGRAVNSSYVDYPLPRAADAPQIRTVFVGSSDEVGPFGAKGLGEIVMLPTGAALANAIAHAVGTRMRDAPFTPDRVLAAIRQRSALPVRAGTRKWHPSDLWIDLMRRAYPLGLHAALDRFGPSRPPGTGGPALSHLEAPMTVDDALKHLDASRAAAPVGGATDVIAAHRQGLPSPAVLVSLRSCPELTRIETDASGALLLGAAVTLAELERDDSVDGVLRETITQIASPQIREAATVAGNLSQAKRCWFYRNGFDCYKQGGPARPCYAVMGDHRFYHAVTGGHRCQAVTPSDLATTLIALDADLTVQSSGSTQTLAVKDLYIGPGETRLAPGDLIAHVLIPAAARRRTSMYRKLALWHGGFAVVSICLSAGWAEDGHSVNDLRVVLGGVAPVPQRVSMIEQTLAGRPVNAALIEASAARWLDSTHPLRSNHWKAIAAANMLASALREFLLTEGGR
jgi:CO/xanthine dehydrogenase Mo-binding subunit/CO/xanthine dehydrogenase FAD-binding subunit